MEIIEVDNCAGEMTTLRRVVKAERAGQSGQSEWRSVLQWDSVLTCTSKCATSADCQDGGSCVTDGANAICQSAADKNTPCDKQADCAAPLACASDYRCRNLCDSDAACNVLGITGRVCVKDANGVKYCAESGEVNPDGGLPPPPLGAPDSGVTEPNGGGAAGGSAGGMSSVEDAGSSGAMNSDAGASDAGAAGQAGGSAGTGGHSVGGSSGGGGTGGAAIAGGAGMGAGAAAGFGGAGTGTVPLSSDPGGAVSVPALAIQGNWYAFGDGVGADGGADGTCEAIGMHLASECSKITSPVWGSFPNTNSHMCTSGSVAKVITGTVGCTAPATSCPDYSTIWGAGIGLHLNVVGSVQMPYNAAKAGIVGVSFDIDAVPPAGIRVEFTNATVEVNAAMWKPGTTNLSPLVVGHNVLLFADVASPTYASPAVPFDPKNLVNIQLFVPTKTTAPADYNFCISNFAALTM